MQRWLRKDMPVMTRTEAEEFFEKEGKNITKNGRTLNDYVEQAMYSYKNDPVRGKNLMVMQSVLSGKPSELDKERIAKAEVDKQKREVIGEALAKKGITGPMKNILEYADINPAAKGTGRRKRKTRKTRKTRASRKNGRRSLKRTTKH